MISHNNLKVDSTITPIMQMHKLRLKEINYLAQDY